MPTFKFKMCLFVCLFPVMISFNWSKPSYSETQGTETIHCPMGHSVAKSKHSKHLYQTSLVVHMCSDGAKYQFGTIRAAS